MEINEFFSYLLPISYPFKIVKTEQVTVETKVKEIIIQVEVDKQYRPEGYPYYHSRYKRRWRHLSLFEYPCYIECDVVMYENPATGSTTSLEIPWARKGSGFTLFFESYILDVLESNCCITATAELLGLHPQRVARIYQAYTQESFERYEPVTPVRLGIDETSTRKGHHYLTVFVDMDTAQIVAIEQGKDAACIAAFASKRSDIDRVKEVSMDMSPAFIKGVEQHLPAASKTFDKFHVFRLVYSHLDKLKDKVKAEKKELFEWLGAQFKLLYELDHKQQASAFLAFWMDALEDIVKDNPLTKSLKRHFEGIVEFFDSKLTNGLLEGINAKIQTIKRIARGYKSVDSFKRRILFAFGLLELRPSKIT